MVVSELFVKHLQRINTFDKVFLFRFNEQTNTGDMKQLSIYQGILDDFLKGFQA